MARSLVLNWENQGPPGERRPESHSDQTLETVSVSKVELHLSNLHPGEEVWRHPIGDDGAGRGEELRAALRGRGAAWRRLRYRTICAIISRRLRRAEGVRRPRGLYLR